MADEHWRHLAGLDPHSLDQLMAEYGQTVWNYAFLLVKKLAVRRDLKGQGLGRLLLEHAENRIIGNGKRFIRLDCMADNERLNRYYLDAGYTHIRRFDGDGWSANLYEKQVEPPSVNAPAP